MGGSTGIRLGVRAAYVAVCRIAVMCNSSASYWSLVMFSGTFSRVHTRRVVESHIRRTWSVDKAGLGTTGCSVHSGDSFGVLEPDL
jgi:hypothetical protein